MSKSDRKFKHAFMAIAATAILFSQSENTLAAGNNSGPDESSEIVEIITILDETEAVTELPENTEEVKDAEAETTAESEAAANPADKARTAAADTNATVPSYNQVREAMLALKDKEGFTEGTTWTNFEPYGSKGNKGEDYKWNGGKIKGADRGVGCAAFAFILSDAAFGNLPSRTIDQGGFQYEDIKPGDILRLSNSHFVIVTQVSPGGVIVAEGNYNKSVHWGRALSKEEVMASNFIVTRYPAGYVSPDSENADEVVSQGTEGNLGWTLTRAGTLTISGTGDIPDYPSDNSKTPSWSNPDSTQNINTIIIKNGVGRIGNYVFSRSQAVTVYLPGSVTAIGTGAFQDSALVSVTLPGSVAEVGDGAFRNCTNLVSASVSEGLKTIGENAFCGCTSLQYIDFPSTIESIGSGAFMSCEKLTRIRFKPGTGDVTFGEKGNGIFAQCWNLTDVTLPQGLTEICDNMFQSCTALSCIYIPSSVTKIGELPFTSTGIQYNGEIRYGGSEDTWKRIGGQFILNAMPNAHFYYNAEFEDPFANDPNDPGDINFDQGSTPENPGGTQAPEKPGGSGTTDPADKPSGRPGNWNQPAGPGGSNIPAGPAGSVSSTGTGTSNGVYVPPADITTGNVTPGSQAGQTAGAVLPPQNSVTAAGQPDTPVLLTDARTETRGSQPGQTADTKRGHLDQSKDKGGRSAGSEIRQDSGRTEQKKTASANGQDSGQESSDPIPETMLSQQPDDSSGDDMVRVIVPAVCLGAGGLGVLYITLRKRR